MGTVPCTSLWTKKEKPKVDCKCVKWLNFKKRGMCAPKRIRVGFGDNATSVRKKT